MAHPMGTYKARCKAYRAIRADKAAKLEALRTKPAVITKIMAANAAKRDWSRASHTNLVGWAVGKDGRPVRV